MKAPPSKLKVSVTADSEREIDEILATRSDEEFLLDSPPPPTHPFSGPEQPIPANRIALLRQIELENAELARRHWWREVAQRVLLITALIVTMAIMAIFIWLLYLAVTTSTQEKQRHYFHVPRTFFDTNDVPKYEEKLFSGQTFVMMPKKMSKVRRLRRQKINDALFNEE